MTPLYARVITIAALAASTLPTTEIAAQCNGALPTLRVAASNSVAFDVDGDGTDDVRIDRTFDGIQDRLDATAINGARLGSLVGANASAAVGQDNSPVFLYSYEEDFSMPGTGLIDDRASGRFLTVEVGGRDGYISFLRVEILDNFTDADIEIDERGVAAVGANNPTTNQCASLQAPVPVSLVSFAADPSPRGVRLAWATATERDNAGFAVERSRDPETGFEEVAFVAGGGSRDAAAAYAYTDAEAPRGVALYYRLRQLDFDGTGTLSELRAVLPLHSPADGLALAGASVVTAGQPLSLALPAGATGIVVADAVGGLRAVVPTGTSASFALPTAGLSPGLYFARVRAGGRAVPFVVR